MQLKLYEEHFHVPGTSCDMRDKTWTINLMEGLPVERKRSRGRQGRNGENLGKRVDLISNRCTYIEIFKRRLRPAVDITRMVMNPLRWLSGYGVLLLSRSTRARPQPPLKTPRGSKLIDSPSLLRASSLLYRRIVKPPQSNQSTRIIIMMIMVI